MANADFSRQQNQPTGGFDASSYRAAAPAEEEVRLTPFQQKLAGLEKALPAALSKQAVAVALCIVVMLACFVGFGGAKLRAKYDTVKNGFTTGVAADSGYALNEELTTRLNTAANIITTASNTLGADSTEVQTAQAALDSFSACLGAVQSDGKIHAPDSLSVYTGGRMHMLYQSNETLGTAIGQLYAKLQEQAADPMKMGAVQGQYSQFNSAQTIISNLHYNDAVQSYQKDVGGFPASVLGKLFGIQGACTGGFGCQHPAAQPAERSMRGGRRRCAERQHHLGARDPQRTALFQLRRRTDRRADRGLHRQRHHRGLRH